MPCYNSSKYIEEVMENVKLQIENKNIELIVVDDNSIDNTFDLISRYKSFQIRVFKNKINLGPNFSRNIGIKNALGEYILFLDSDDKFSTDAFSLLEGFCISNSFDFLSFGFNFISGEKKILSRHKFNTDILLGSSIIEDFFDGKIYSVCWNKIYKRDFLIKNNIKFIEDKTHGRDTIFTLDCCYYASKYIKTDIILYFSNVRDDSFSRSFSLRNISSLVNNIYTIQNRLNYYSLDKNFANYYLAKHVRYILLYSTFNLTILDYFKALIKLLKINVFSILFSKISLKKSKMVENIISVLIFIPVIILPVSFILKLFKYKPY